MSTALARFNINNLSQPVSGGIVDSLSNIEPKIKPTVISSTKNSNNLVLLMLSFGYSQSRILFLQIVRTNQTSFMPQKLFTRTEMLRKQSLSLLLYDLLVLATNCIPKFRFSLVNKVDPRQIQILSMPAEESLPTSHVAIWSVDALDLVAERIGE